MNMLARSSFRSFVFVCYSALLPSQTSYGQQQRYPVADMHYHLSMRSYNQNGLALHAGQAVNPEWLNYRCSRKLGKKYGGYWVRPNVTNSHMGNFTQATLPHSLEGNMKLIFNSITPFEYNLNDEFFDRVFAKWFKTHAKFKWLKQIGTWDRLTHFDSYTAEINMLTKQNSHNKEWKYWLGTETSMDPNQLYIVNVIEGAHVLQDEKFRPDFQFSPLEKQHRSRYLDAVEKQTTAEAKTNPTLQNNKSEEKKYMQQSENQIEEVRKEIKQSVKQYEDLNNVPRQEIPKLDSLVQTREEEIIDELQKNIIALKTNYPPVFMVSIGHLSYNGMLGHAPALDGDKTARILLRKFFRTRVSNDQVWQQNWDDKFYSPPKPNAFGNFIIENLVSRNNGHRIFIDIKHSSYTTRKWFYENIAEKENVPPMCSHCAANGLSDIHYSVSTDEYAYADSKSVKNLYPLSINLYDEEIPRICKLGGIIAITLEERVLGGYMNNASASNPGSKTGSRKKDNLKRLKQLKSEGRLTDLIKTIQNEAQQKPYNYRLSNKEAFDILCKDYIAAEPFMHNLFYMIDKSTLGDKAWNHFSIGSDFDGFIDPIDIIPTASQFPYFRNRISQLIPLYLEFRDNDPESHKKYFADEKDKENKLNLLFYESLKNFVEKHFKK